jgi:hypothetical protein
MTGYPVKARKCNSRSLDIHYAQVPVLRRKVSRRALEVSIEIAGPDLEGLVADPACT